MQNVSCLSAICTCMNVTLLTKPYIPLKIRPSKMKRMVHAAVIENSIIMATKQGFSFIIGPILSTAWYAWRVIIAIAMHVCSFIRKWLPLIRIIVVICIRDNKTKRLEMSRMTITSGVIEMMSKNNYIKYLINNILLIIYIIIIIDYIYNYICFIV